MATYEESHVMADLPGELRSLLLASSKHSDYQLLHPSLGALLGDLPQPEGRHEAQRHRYMAGRLSMADRTVLDIGANTGYFTFAALADGARKVVSQEGNAEHARFIQLAAAGMGLSERLEVRPAYFDFKGSSDDRFDVALCLNVLHHLGDDFGDRSLTLNAAKQEMLEALNRLALQVHDLWLQIGFNWKGDRRYPLFGSGTKAELIDFVRRGTQGSWRIQDVAAVHPGTRDYAPLSEANAERFDALGEFLNRPLFHMTSVRLAAGDGALPGPAA